jgi:hypothetical protein
MKSEVYNALTIMLFVFNAIETYDFNDIQQIFKGKKASSARFKPIEPIGPCAGVIYSRLFKYAQQHTAGFTDNIIGPYTT